MMKKKEIYSVVISFLAVIAYGISGALLDRASVLFGIVSIFLYGLMIVPILRLMSNNNQKKVQFKNKTQAIFINVIVYLLSGIAVYFALFSKIENRFVISFGILVLLLIFVFTFNYLNKRKS